MTLRVSWSQLRAHEECKQRGYLRRTGKREALKNQRGFFPGNVTDRVVRSWLQSNPEKNLGAMPDMVADTMAEQEQAVKEEGKPLVWRDAEDREAIKAECIKAVRQIEPALLKYVLPFDYQADYKFSVPLRVPHPAGGSQMILLIGFMDIIVRDSQGRFAVWDVKHTADDDYWRKTVGQLSFYDLAVYAETGKPTYTTGLLQPLCKEPVLSYPISHDRRAQLMQRVSAMSRDVWLKNHAPNTHAAECDYCDVRHACSKFAPVIVDGKKRVSF